MIVPPAVLKESSPVLMKEQCSVFERMELLFALMKEHLLLVLEVVVSCHVRFDFLFLKLML